MTAAKAYPDADTSRPLYLGATTNIAASVTADAVGIRTTELRKRLAPVVADHLGFRPRTGGQRRPLNKGEHVRLNHLIGTQLLVSWSELPHSADYLDALIRALDPQLQP